ncbi:MAG: 2-phosphosulfolactate phosphatase [Ignavibacteriales bacterium]|nr:2-phosphosulfolactate phosphatase [Ignavibacteriales bacterium]
MKININFSPSLVEELYFAGKNTVVIDVLRATTTIVEALKNGAKEVIPVSTFEFAQKASGSFFGGQTLLGGERNTKKIEGFNLGNSPLEYTKDVVNGKSIILFTTNGSKSIVKAKFSKNLFICSFINLHTVAKHTAQLGNDLEILCAGRNGGFSIEDSVCAGKLVAEILTHNSEAVLTDSAKAGLVLSKSYGKSLLKILKESEHGKILVANGFMDDVKYCAQVGIIDLLPVYSEGTIKIPASLSNGNV